jgi:hypothetical protein
MRRCMSSTPPRARGSCSQGHPAPAQFFFHHGAIGNRASRGGGRWGRRKQKPLQRRIVQAVRQWPGKPCKPSALKIAVHSSNAQRQRPRDGPLAQAPFKLHTQNVADLPHRQSLGWHGHLVAETRPHRPFGLSANAPTEPTPQDAHDPVEIALTIPWILHDKIVIEHYMAVWASYGPPTEHYASDAHERVLEFLRCGRKRYSLKTFIASTDGKMAGSAVCQLHLAPYPTVIDKEHRQFGYIWHFVCST